MFLLLLKEIDKYENPKKKKIIVEYLEKFVKEFDSVIKILFKYMIVISFIIGMFLTIFISS
jgi:hypothetical protein